MRRPTRREATGGLLAAAVIAAGSAWEAHEQTTRAKIKAQSESYIALLGAMEGRDECPPCPTIDTLIEGD